MAESLSIKPAKDVAELEAMIVRAQKRRINVQKQERSLQPNVHMEQFESDDVWNHVNTCHRISQECYKREGLLEQVKAAVKHDSAIVSSPVIISGDLQCGKTWLCAQIPSLLGEESITLVRFCGLTRLTSTLTKLLRGLSKQLHVLYGSQILPRAIEQYSVEDTFQLFRDILNEVSVSAGKPVVLVLDSLDKLAASARDLMQFIALCEGCVPPNVVMVMSLTKKAENSEFYDCHSEMKNLSMDEADKLIREYDNNIVLVQL